MPRPSPLRFIYVLLCTLSLEVGWVASVRLVQMDSVTLVVAVAMMMQAIVYSSFLLVVDDRRLALGGIIGAGLGALVGMLLPLAAS